MQYRVIKEWTASYEAPIAVAGGDILELDGRADCWDGYIWLWARCPATGREGWIPDSLPVSRGGKHVARRDYSAKELTCQKGQFLTATDETHGWVLCEDHSGEIGWVPQSCLAAKSVSG